MWQRTRSDVIHDFCFHMPSCPWPASASQVLRGSSSSSQDSQSYSLPQHLLSLGLFCLMCNKQSELGLGNKFGEPTQEPHGSWLMHPYQGILRQGPKQLLGPFVLRIFLSKFPETMPTAPVLGSCEKELKNLFLEFSSVQSLSRVRLFATP